MLLVGNGQIQVCATKVRFLALTAIRRVDLEGRQRVDLTRSRAVGEWPVSARSGRCEEPLRMTPSTNERLRAVGRTAASTRRTSRDILVKISP